MRNCLLQRSAHAILITHSNYGSCVHAYAVLNNAVLVRGKQDTKASVRVLRDGILIDVSALRKPITLKGVTFSRLNVLPSKGISHGN